MSRIIFLHCPLTPLHPTTFRLLNRTSNHEAPRTDGLPNWAFRDFCDKMSEPVCVVFKATVRGGIVQLCWKKRMCFQFPKSTQRRQSNPTCCQSRSRQQSVRYLSHSSAHGSWSDRKPAGQPPVSFVVDSREHHRSTVRLTATNRFEPCSLTTYAKAFDHVYHTFYLRLSC